MGSAAVLLVTLLAAGAQEASGGPPPRPAPPPRVVSPADVSEALRLNKTWPVGDCAKKIRQAEKRGAETGTAQDIVCFEPDTRSLVPSRRSRDQGGPGAMVPPPAPAG
ncbi:hypothetical protein [Actinomadura macrotermitis]|uniref:hypothetical protein n=1 Tax=Actinomadura macrotermitis TaxID=2585200 RepID=UPI00129698D7|nr:hypothetical protein [Actinomadura macrotermitis]